MSNTHNDIAQSLYFSLTGKCSSWNFTVGPSQSWQKTLLLEGALVLQGIMLIV